MTRVNGKNGLTCGVPISDLAVHWDPVRVQADVQATSPRTGPRDIPKTLCTPTGLPGARPGDRHATHDDYETLDWSVDADGIATLTLDRPDAAQRLRP